MPTINILSDAEIHTLENPPIFTGEERKKYFRQNQTIMKVLQNLRTPENQVGFVLHLGYFKKTNRFFSAENFHETDLQYVKQLLKVPLTIEMASYNRKTFNRHKKIILDISGILPHQALEVDWVQLHTWWKCLIGFTSYYSAHSFKINFTFWTVFGEHLQLF
jgi:hypothetical protein